MPPAQDGPPAPSPRSPECSHRLLAALSAEDALQQVLGAVHADRPLPLRLWGWSDGFPHPWGAGGSWVGYVVELLPYAPVPGLSRARLTRSAFADLILPPSPQEGGGEG